MIVSDLMTREVHSLPPSAPLQEALALLAEHGVRHLPVVRDGRLVGIVSDRDLLAATGGIESERIDHTLSEVMHDSPKTAGPDDTLVTVSVEMGLAKIGCLPVVDAKGALLGLVTETDLMRAYLAASREGRISGEHDPPVDRLMSTEPRWVTPDVALADAMLAARHQDFRHLPVLDEDDHIIGMISDRDLCRELGRGTAPDTPVAQAMTRRVYSTSPGEALTKAAERMLEHHISCLPVLRGSTLVGILSSTDMVDHCMNTLGQG